MLVRLSGVGVWPVAGEWVLSARRSFPPLMEFTIQSSGSGESPGCDRFGIKRLLDQGWYSTRCHNHPFSSSHEAKSWV